jgi:Xaa-Pro aminopeptidase
MAGAQNKDVDAVAREIIDGGGHAEHFGHGLGHGVGLEVHEAPRLGKTADGTLEAGNAVTVEPGIYLPGEVGVRIEDLVIVTDGEPDILTGFPKDLVSVD